MDRISTDDISRGKRRPTGVKKSAKKKVTGGFYQPSAKNIKRSSSNSSKAVDEKKSKSDNIFKRGWNETVKFSKERWDVLTNKCLPFDKPLLIIVMLLLIIGLIMMYSASYAYAYQYYNNSGHFITRQLVFAVAGVIGMALVSTFSPTKLKGKASYILLAVSYFMLALVLFLPEVQYVHRWISLGFFSFQPSEIAKFAVILFCATYITDHYRQINMTHFENEKKKLKANRSKFALKSYEYRQNFMYGILPYGVMLGPMLLLLILEPHLSCTVLIVLIIASMMYVGGTKKGYFGALGILGVIAFFLIVYTEIVPYGRRRINVWLDPFVDKLGDGWQNIQSLYAISSGGLFGVGLGNSRQKYLYISEPQNDFVFAVVCEELGFIGAAFIIILFMLFVYRGLSLSIANPDRFSKLVGIGITCQIGFQALLNVCVVTKIVPNTGISLPFFSYGGTSLMMLLMEIGVLLAISRNSPNKIG